MLATKKRVCNAAGTEFLPSTCDLRRCEDGYAAITNACVAKQCTAGTAYPNDSCASTIPFAIAATQGKACNPTETGFVYGACQLTSCGYGYHQSGNACLADFVVDNIRVRYNGASEESATKVAIKYAWSDFRGIDSYDFYATWKFRVTANTADRAINLNFDMSWSSATVKVDGVTISTITNSNLILPHLFTVGVHEVEIAYVNNWHTTNFNVSWTDNARLTVPQGTAVITPLIDADTKIVYVGVYRSEAFYNDVTVLLQAQTKPVLLVMSSYHAINWLISNPSNVSIKGIVYGAYSPGSTVTAHFSVPKFEIATMPYSDSGTPPSIVTTLAGRPADHTFGSYRATQFTIPNLTR